MPSKLKKGIKNYGLALLVVIGMTGLMSVFVLNLTFIYPIISRAYALDVATGLDHGVLFDHYQRIVHYLNWPWITTLYLPDFPMSETGAFHFWEVKVIFHVIHLMVLIFVVALIWAKCRKKDILSVFNTSATLIFFIFGALFTVMLFDFDFFFYWFHRALFNNDYWLFSPRYDPVINALPYQLFLMKGILLITCLFAWAICCKLLFYMKKSVN